MIIGDIAGLEDQQQEYVQLQNILVNKLVFNYAAFLKFIVPITLPLIKESRGYNLIKLLKTVQGMFKCNLKEASKFILPVLTLVTPSNVSAIDEDFDLDIVKSRLLEIFNHEIENQERLIKSYKHENFEFGEQGKFVNDPSLISN